MVLSCQIQAQAISFPENASDPHEKKAGWLSEPVYMFWKGNISGIFRESNHDSLVFSL
jgi:hypothetical protein